MYPNPAQDEIAITLNHEKAIFKLYSLSAQLLLEIELSQDKNNIPQQNLSSGIYLVNITSSSFTGTKKLIIN